MYCTCLWVLYDHTGTSTPPPWSYVKWFQSNSRQSFKRKRTEKVDAEKYLYNRHCCTSFRSSTCLLLKNYWFHMVMFLVIVHECAWGFKTGLNFEGYLHSYFHFVNFHCHCESIFCLNNSFLPGWDQGLLGMCVGEKRKLKIPAKLGYGEQGSPPTIPGNIWWVHFFLANLLLEQA